MEYRTVPIVIRVSDPHSFHANNHQGFQILADPDPDPGFDKFADQDLGLAFFQKLWF